MRRWSVKQKQVVRLGASDKPYHLVYGASGSGKSSAAIFGFLLWSLQFNGRHFLMVAKTQKQVHHVVGKQFDIAMHEMGIPYRVTRDGWEIGNNKYMIFSGNDVSAQPRVQGFDASGIYIDEVVNIPELVMMELDNRLREISGGKVVMTANPANPAHWFKKRYVDRKADIGMAEYLLLHSDNPGLKDGTVLRMSRSSYGGFYNRRILGEWAPLHGAVFPSFYPPKPPPDERTAMRWYLSVDPGDSGVTHALLIGEFEEEYWVYDEWRWDGAERSQLTHGDQAERLRIWVSGKGISLAAIVCDSASQNMMLQLHRAFDLPVLNSRKVGEQKSLLEGIAITQHYLDSGRLRLSEAVPYLTDELMMYSWDEKAAEKGEDKPVKERDHGVDALRYFVYTIAQLPGRREIDVTWD
ncbi:MAG: PBSX family phage terminase large subunit [Gammaproteobacteria bacterium]|nr:PBSX family phage terminase large subunit [Gammaproteobacteria bacterium]